MQFLDFVPSCYVVVSMETIPSKALYKGKGPATSQGKEMTGP
jgi:hypothetical protein